MTDTPPKIKTAWAIVGYRDNHEPDAHLTGREVTSANAGTRSPLPYAKLYVNGNGRNLHRAGLDAQRAAVLAAGGYRLFSVWTFLILAAADRDKFRGYFLDAKSYKPHSPAALLAVLRRMGFPVDAKYSARAFGADLKRLETEGIIERAPVSDIFDVLPLPRILDNGAVKMVESGNGDKKTRRAVSIRAKVFLEDEWDGLAAGMSEHGQLLSVADIQALRARPDTQRPARAPAATKPVARKPGPKKGKKIGGVCQLEPTNKGTNKRPGTVHNARPMHSNLYCLLTTQNIKQITSRTGKPPTAETNTKIRRALRALSGGCAAHPPTAAVPGAIQPHAASPARPLSKKGGISPAPAVYDGADMNVDTRAAFITLCNTIRSSAGDCMEWEYPRAVDPVQVGAWCWIAFQSPDAARPGGPRNHTLYRRRVGSFLYRWRLYIAALHAAGLDKAGALDELRKRLRFAHELAGRTKEKFYSSPALYIQRWRLLMNDLGKAYTRLTGKECPKKGDDNDA